MKRGIVRSEKEELEEKTIEMLRRLKFRARLCIDKRFQLMPGPGVLPLLLEMSERPAECGVGAKLSRSPGDVRRGHDDRDGQGAANSQPPLARGSGLELRAAPGPVLC